MLLHVSSDALHEEYRLPISSISYANLGVGQDGDTDNIHRRLHGSD